MKMNARRLLDLIKPSAVFPILYFRGKALDLLSLAHPSPKDNEVSRRNLDRLTFVCRPTKARRGTIPLGSV